MRDMLGHPASVAGNFGHPKGRSPRRCGSEAGSFNAESSPDLGQRSTPIRSHGVPTRPRILFLNRSYWPDSEATGQLLTDLCESLTDEFDVHVLAGQPNAAAAENWKDEPIRNGVHIHRVSHTVMPKSNLLLKGVNFVSFAAACRRQVLKVPQPDLVIFETCLLYTSPSPRDS